jgi:hypothetical protein
MHRTNTQQSCCLAGAAGPAENLALSLFLFIIQFTEEYNINKYSYLTFIKIIVNKKNKKRTKQQQQAYRVIIQATMVNQTRTHFNKAETNQKERETER